MKGDKAVFVDTNVLIYANLAEMPLHPEASAAMSLLSEANTQVWISLQVLREYIAITSRKDMFKQPLPMATISLRVRQFQGLFHVAQDNPLVLSNLLTLLEEFPVGGKQIFDANIVATMMAYNIPQIITHNVKDFQRYSAYVTVIPLVSPKA